MRSFCHAALLILLALLSPIFPALKAQVTIEIGQVPAEYTPLLDDLYIAGNFNMWAPGDAAYRLTNNGDGTYTFVLQGTPGSQIEYKFTRGSWDEVETQASGAFLPNRTFIFNNNQVIHDTIRNWEDMLGNHTASGNLHILDLDFGMPQLGRTRRIWVYLPQNYHVTTQRYPVLYMHDGQNVFDAEYTFAGVEWAVDEAMENIQNSGGNPAIVVGVDNGGFDRINEYSPWWDPQYGGGQGELYVDWMVNTLKPFIDGYFRTKTGREYTGIMGSSLGGLISHYAALERPDVFSKAGIFSPSYWFSDSVFRHTRLQGHSQAMRLYMLAGGQESATMVPNMLRMADSLQAHGFSASELNPVVKSDGQHSEWFWAREFEDAYRWLFADWLVNAEAPVKDELAPWLPTLLHDEIRIPVDFSGPLTLNLYQLNGQLLFHRQLQAGDLVDVRTLQNGIYLAEITYKGRTARKKLVKMR
ncbi:MAG: alpha/beta hydrolase-fold protein [Bacteroidota bacterium]